MADDGLRIRYAEVEGGSVAWASHGSGPALVVGGWWCSHLRLNWEDPAFRGLVSALADRRSVVRYDRPGTGASDRRVDAPRSLDEECTVLESIVDATGEGSVAVLGASSGAAVAATFAARHPERVSRLVLYGGYARGADIAAPAAREATMELVANHWGLGSRLLSDLFIPDATAAERDAFAAFQRRSATPEQARASLETAYGFDCAQYLPRVEAQTLVLHRREDRAVPAALGRELADQIPGAQFYELDGTDHFPWRGDSRAVAEVVRAFLSAEPLPQGSPSKAIEPLTEREREVISLVAKGLTDSEIADHLVLSIHTVHRHVANIRTKLGVSSRAAAAAQFAGDQS